MLATRFRQVLSGICASFASLSISPPGVPAVKPPSPLRPNQTNRLRVGTFNVHSLASHRKQHDTLPQDLRRYRVDVLGLEETKLATLGRQRIGDYTLLSLPATQELHGVGFAVSPRIRPYLHCYVAASAVERQYSDRVGVLQQMLPHTGRVNVITAYSPHSGKPLADVDRFYADLRTLLDQLAHRDITIITGDFNAKLGHRLPGESFLGHHARGIRNRSGHVLADFCLTYRLFATNTGFQKRAKNKTTWSQRRTDYCVYNQIDYILCPHNCRRFCMDAQSWGGATTASDHKLVTADFVLMHARRLRFHKRPARDRVLRLARDRLAHDPDLQDEYAEALRLAMQPHTEASVAQNWQSTMDTVLQTAEATIGLTSAPTRRRKYDDDILAALTERQRALQLRIYNDRQANTAALRRERNAILHQIRHRCRDLANTALDEKIAHIETLSHSAQMFEAVRAIHRTRAQPLLLHDATVKYILHQPTANKLVRSHFQAQFSIPARLPITPDTEARALEKPVTAAEIKAALLRLNNKRAAGPDNIPAELLKYGADVFAPRLAGLVNQSFERGEPLQLGAGTLLCLPKPNKPRGDRSSLRPIVLLNSIRKAISILVLHRISPAVENFLSPHQSGFRKHRSTADAVWTHRWLCARVQRYQESIHVLGIDCIHVLGIDLSRAFDTIDRRKLIEVLKTFLTDDDIRLLRLLLANTTLALRTENHTLEPFTSNTGTSQGDSLSPVLFVIYLGAALRDLASEFDVPHSLLQQMVVYADDADFICRDPAIVQVILERAPEISCSLVADHEYLQDGNHGVTPPHTPRRTKSTHSSR